MIAPARWALRRLLFVAARGALRGQAVSERDGNPIRWLDPEIDAVLADVRPEADRLRRHARLDALPNFGARLMVELAVLTLACNRALRRAGVPAEDARRLTADIGWRVYRRMLLAASAPFRAATRDPGRRLRWTVGALLRFPFAPRGAPGYAADVRRDGEDLLTRFTCCPPQSFARRAAEAEGDPELLEAFRRSWCRYDWPGADLIAGDGARGRYRRRRTLSHGDAVCDMRWSARPADAAVQGKEKAE